MHNNSLRLMRDFKQRFVKPGSSVLDVGAYNVNGTYRDIFKDCKYTGFDVVAGPNVDIVGWDNIKGTYDVVISGQTLEHCKFPWEIVKSIKKHTRKGGLICIIVPAHIWEHRHPIDTYRFYPDGLLALFEYAKICATEVKLVDYVQKTRSGAHDFSDTIIIGVNDVL